MLLKRSSLAFILAAMLLASSPAAFACSEHLQQALTLEPAAGSGQTKIPAMTPDEKQSQAVKAAAEPSRPVRQPARSDFND